MKFKFNWRDGHPHHPRFPSVNTKKRQWAEYDPVKPVPDDTELFTFAHWSFFLTPPRIYDPTIEKLRYFDYWECTDTKEEVIYQEDDWVTHEFSNEIQNLGFYGLTFHGQLILSETVTQIERAYKLIKKFCYYAIYVTRQSGLPITEEIRSIIRNPETNEIRRGEKPWGGRYNNQIFQLVGNPKVRTHLVWVKGEPDVIEDIIRRSIQLDNDVYRRLKLVAIAHSTYHRLESESTLELLGRSLELKAKTEYDKHLGKNKITTRKMTVSEIWRKLEKAGYITNELYTVVDIIRQIRNITVHDKLEIDQKTLEVLSVCARHILALDWAGDKFNNPSEFQKNAQNTWNLDHGPNVLLPLLESCPECGKLKLPNFDCRYRKKHKIKSIF